METINWEKHLKLQENSSYCGVATVQMILDSIGIEKSQKQIARAIYKSWWGTPTDLLYGYLSKYFEYVNYRDYMVIDDLSYYLKMYYAVIAHIDMGHYCIVSACNNNDNNKDVTIVDPKDGIKTISVKSFEKRWFLSEIFRDRTCTGGWLLWMGYPLSASNKER